MLSDVFLAPLAGIGPRHVISEVLRGAPENARIGIVENIPVLKEKPEQSRKILNLDVAAHIGFCKAQCAAAHGRPQHLEVVELEKCMFACSGVAKGPAAPAGKGHRQSALVRDTHKRGASLFQKDRLDACSPSWACLLTIECDLTHDFVPYRGQPMLL